MATESSRSHFEVLLGKQTPERMIEDQIHFNQRVDPLFEPLQHRIWVLAQHLTEELKDPRYVDPKLEIYLSAKKLALKFTMFLVTSQLYYKPSIFNDPRIDRAAALKININRFSSQLKLLSSVFVETSAKANAFVHSEIAKILMTYARELERIDLSKTNKFHFGILRGINPEEIEKIERKLGFSGLPTVYKEQLTALAPSILALTGAGGHLQCRSAHRSNSPSR